MHVHFMEVTQLHSGWRPPQRLEVVSGVHFLVLSWCWDINSGRLTIGGGGGFPLFKKSRPDDLRKRHATVLASWVMHGRS
jgi:hypothetical protein